MVFTEHVSDDASGFLMRAVVSVVQLMHREQHTAVYRFQAVSHVRKRAAHDDAHRVIQVRAAHFLFKRNAFRFINLLTNQRPIGFASAVGLAAAGTALAFFAFRLFFCVFVLIVVSHL